MKEAKRVPVLRASSYVGSITDTRRAVPKNPWTSHSRLTYVQTTMYPTSRPLQTQSLGGRAVRLWSQKVQLKELWFEEHVKKWLREEAMDEAPAEAEEVVEV